MFQILEEHCVRKVFGFENKRAGQGKVDFMIFVLYFNLMSGVQND